MSELLTGLIGASLVVGSFLWAAVSDMFKDEFRTRLESFPLSLLALAAWRLPCAMRDEALEEWGAELDFILRDAEGLPLTRLTRGTFYAVDLALRGAPAMARQMRGGRQGRHIFYEGGDPDGFAQQIQTEFGFDLTKDPRWGCWDPGFTTYSFDCPPGLLDEIYGSGRFPMGS
jgi:hypothetical protein